MKKKTILAKTCAFALAAAIVGSMVPIWQVSATPVFEDVPSTMWCYQSVIDAVNGGYMSGYGGGKFGPNDAVTRAQIAQVLYNKFGKDSGTDAGFTDVSADMWCAKAVTWAVKNGIMSGYGGGKFGPNDKLTRQQLVTILYNQAGKPAVSGDLNKYTDKGSVAGYATNGFLWATANKIVNGTSATTLSPSGTATRGQVATIILNYVKATSEDNNDSGNTTEPEKPSQPEAKPETKPEQGSTATVPSDVDAYVKTLPERVQHAISAWYDDLFFSNPEEVKAAGIQKRVDKPTLGYTATANKNGYHTECTLDLSGAVLDYDVVDIMNRYRHEDGRSTHDAVWAYGDMLEEQALAGAKYPQLSEDSMWAGNVTKADSLEQAMQIFFETGKLTTFMGNASDVIAAAHYTNSEGDTYYALAKSNSAKNPCGNVKAAQHNYDIQ